MEDRSEKFVSTHGRRRDTPGPFQARSDSFSSELNPCLIQSSKAKYFFWCLERKICHLSNSFCQGNTSSGDEVFSVSEGLRHPLLERFTSFCSISLPFPSCQCQAACSTMIWCSIGSRKALIQPEIAVFLKYLFPYSLGKSTVFTLLMPVLFLHLTKAFLFN